MISIQITEKMVEATSVQDFNALELTINPYYKDGELSVSRSRLKIKYKDYEMRIKFGLLKRVVNEAQVQLNALAPQLIQAIQGVVSMEENLEGDKL